MSLLELLVRAPEGFRVGFVAKLREADLDLRLHAWVADQGVHLFEVPKLAIPLAELPE